MQTVDRTTDSLANLNLKQENNMTKFTKDMQLGVPTDHAPFCIDGFCNEDGGKFEVCSVWGVNDDSSGCEQSEANAHLFAAAPELYDEIERDIEWLSKIKTNFALGSYEYRSICLKIESKNKLLSEARGE